jgi:hypothetical protein
MADEPDLSDVPAPHRERRELRHLKVVAGASPLYAQVELDGKPWAGLVGLDISIHTGNICEVTATFRANMEIDAQLKKVKFRNAPFDPTDPKPEKAP